MKKDAGGKDLKETMTDILVSMNEIAKIMEEKKHTSSGERQRLELAINEKKKEIEEKMERLEEMGYSKKIVWNAIGKKSMENTINKLENKVVKTEEEKREMEEAKKELKELKRERMKEIKKRQKHR